MHITKVRNLTMLTIIKILIEKKSSNSKLNVIRLLFMFVMPTT